ncbi:hypothetical protein RJ640_015868 [Escallonia rubra]|uniref:Fe2OG dioxygenase domain-containing protein n=1 Tax=Escallonia rubra TaxID=112253 RepID=A0AA88QWM0_9ASTE|nr:hypothetical protein RJ640_015868 [Escallonia rubra]
MADCFAISTQANDFPVIDLSGSIAAVVAEIADACEKWGAFQVVNHGMPLELHAKFELAMKKFFAQPTDEKRKLRKDIGGVKPYDYGYEEFAKNVNDWKEVFDFPLEKQTATSMSYDLEDTTARELIHSWPEYPSDFRYLSSILIHLSIFFLTILRMEACVQYGQEMEKLSFKLMELISLSLGLPRQRLNGFFKDHTSMGRLIHCPPCPTPQLVLGTHEHTDVGALTILSQDSAGGLEAKRTFDGKWIPVKFVPDAYVINMGDMLEVWSNKKYVSLVHRAKVNSERERFSIPFFFNPAYYVVMEPIEELTNEQNPAKYRAFNWGKYYGSRKYGNFKNPEIDVLRLKHFKV